MGTLFSGVGLVSGLDISAIVDQLVALDSRPRDIMLARIGRVDAQRAAYADISGRIKAALSRVTALTRRSFFESVKASSSNAAALSVSAKTGVASGSYSFIVKQLASTHQLMSRGFASRDATVGAGTVTIESAQARVNGATRLETLNGFAGVQRGAFEIEDASGAKATINVGDAATLNDVVARVNAAGLRVRAQVSGDGLVLTDAAGGAIQTREVNGGRVASDLGFGPGRMYASAGRLEGSSLVYLTNRSPLSALNDGVGVRGTFAAADFSISGSFGSFDVSLSEVLNDTTRLERLNHGAGVQLGRVRVTTEDANGTQFAQEVDLSGMKTIGDVRNALAGSLEGVAITLADNHLVASYADGSSTKALKIEDVSGTAARDLGIAGTSDAGKISGAGVLRVDSIGDVLNAIRYAAGNDGSVTASIDGAGLRIDGAGPIQLNEKNGSRALADLGLAAGDHAGAVSGRRLLARVNSVLLDTLNGGRGYDTGVLKIQSGSASADIDLTSAQSLQDVIDAIGAASDANNLGVEATLDANGTRLILRSRDGLTPLSVRDLTGSFATTLGLNGTGPELRSGSLERQYIAESTALTTLNQGRGVTLGTIRVTNSRGAHRDIAFNPNDAKTLGDIIRRLNSDSTFGVTARINDSGDGLLLEDTLGGGAALTVADQAGTLARDLNLLKPAEGGKIDGAFALRLEIGANETLEQVVKRINDGGRLAKAAILNDGSSLSPYRLQLTSAASGGAGELIVDGLDVSTLTRAQDAAIVFGADANSGAVLISSDNRFEDVVPGLDLEINEATDEPVTVTIGRNIDAILEQLEGLVVAYNAAADRINEVTEFDQATETRGLLFGDGAVQFVESRLLRAFTGTIRPGGGAIRRLSDVGVKLQTVENGGKLEFDAEKFRAALDANPEGVIEFFTSVEDGAAARIDKALKELADPSGLIDNRTKGLDRERELYQSRVEDMNVRIQRKRDRLTRQFLAMERALSDLQGQQSALGQLSGLISGASSAN